MRDVRYCARGENTGPECCFVSMAPVSEGEGAGAGASAATVQMVNLVG